MEVSVQVDKRQLARVERMFRNAPVKLQKILASAVNDTAKQEKVQISKRIRDKVLIRKKDIDQYISFSRATPSNPASLLRVSKSSRIPLKHFRARQVGVGVTYQIEKDTGRRVVLGAFGPRIAKLGGHVFKRRGKARLPIVKLFGPSAWGVFLKHGMPRATQKSATELLRKNIDRRVRFELLKASGQIKR